MSGWFAQILSKKLGISCGEPRLPIAPLSSAAKVEVMDGAKLYGLLGPTASL